MHDNIQTEITSSTLTFLKERLQVIFNELSVLSTTLYLISITTITLQKNHSKINDTAALFIPAPPPACSTTTPSLARLHTAPSFSPFIFSTLHRSCSSSSGDPCHKRLHHFLCTIRPHKSIKQPVLGCVEVSVCIKPFHEYLLAWSLCVWLRVPVCIHICVCMRWPMAVHLKHIHL